MIMYDGSLLVKGFWTEVEGDGEEIIGRGNGMWRWNTVQPLFSCRTTLSRSWSALALALSPPHSFLSHTQQKKLSAPNRQPTAFQIYLSFYL